MGETPAPFPRRRVPGAAILAATGVALVVTTAVFFAVEPVGRAGEPRRTVMIRRGARGWEIAADLAAAGAVRSRWTFLALAALRGDLRRLKPGEYVFDPPIALGEVEAAVADGQVVLHRVTVPEGFTAQEIALRLAARNLADPDRFLALVRDAVFSRRLGVDAPSLEGYLFPDTYQLTRGMTEEEILSLMVHRFRERFGAAEDERARALGLTRSAVVTLASIIEKEARAAAERPLISAVFHNRLRRHMPLQADPSILYTFPEKRGRLTREDLQHPDPYNTYTVPGLPPGPIANPGMASIRAALEPAEVSYLYFVARKDGTHIFSHTLAEHTRAVRREQGASRG